MKKSDFTVLVRMGTDRLDDEYYVLPTRVLREELEARRLAYLKMRKPDGQPYLDIGHWSLFLKDQKSDLPGTGIRSKWAKFKDNWELLAAANL